MTLIFMCAFLVVLVACSTANKIGRAADRVGEFAQITSGTLTNQVSTAMLWLFGIQQNVNALITSQQVNAQNLTDKAAQFLVALTFLVGVLTLYFRYRTQQANKHVTDAIKEERKNRRD